MITILVKPQKIKLKWSGSIISYYKNKGYEYTGRFDEFEVDIDDLNPDSNVKIECICDYCGEKRILPYNKYLSQTKNHKEKYACKKCVHKKIKELNGGVHPNSEKLKGKKALSKEEVIKIVESKNNNKLLNPDDYINMKVKNLRIICGSCGKEFLSSLSNITNSHGMCHDCGIKKSTEVKRYSKKFVEDYINSINGNILLNPDDFTDVNNKNLNVRCGKCGNIYTVSFSKYKNSNQVTCPSCFQKTIGEKLKLSKEQLIRYIESENGNILLNPEDYKNNQTINLKIKCGECGNVYLASLANYQSGQIRCHNCSSKKTRGERLVENCLEKFNIEYENEKRFDGCKDKRCLPFDFYLFDYNTCIEFDGRQHFEPVYGEESFEMTKLHDKIKNDYCYNNDIKLIRIPYWESQNIEKILTKELHI